MASFDTIKQSHLIELENLRSSYNKLLEEQKAKVRELERGLEKERELRIKESIQVEQEVAIRTQQAEQIVR